MQNATPKTKKSTRVKQWMKEHSEELTAATIVVGFVGGCIALAIADQKQIEKQADAANRWIRETNEWVNEQNNARNRVYRLEDGRFLTVEENAKQETHIR